MLQLTDVRIFVEIVRTGSFTLAAKAVGLPKSSVARNLARLEAELGCGLFHRTTRKVTLSDAGRSFLPHARRFLDDLVEATNALRSFGDGAAGTLLVTSPGTFGRAFVAPCLPEFRRKHPNVRVILNLTPAKVDIAAGQADVAIRIGPVAQPDVTALRLGQVNYCIVASPTYLDGRSPIAQPDDLSGQEMIALRPPWVDHRLDLVNGPITRSIRSLPTLDVNDPESVRLAALAGGGIAALPTFLIADDVAQGRLTRILPDWAPKSAPISAIFDETSPPPARVLAFLEFLQEGMGRQMPWSVSL